MYINSILSNLKKQSLAGLLFAILLWACTGDLSPGLGVQVTPFIPPTPHSTVTPLSVSTPTSPVALKTHPTSTPQCNNNLRFLEDLTIADGTIVPPKEKLDKRWSVENNGTCNWDQTYSLRLIGGPDLGSLQEQSLYPARSGTTATLRIRFEAPQEPGTYRSAWQAHGPDGQPFGDPIFIEVIVAEESN